MTTYYSGINLAELPVPDAVAVPDTSALFSAWLERLLQLHPAFSALVESDPAFKLGEVNAWQVALLMGRMNDDVRAVLLASAGGADLDHLGAGFDVPRKLIDPGDAQTVPPVPPVWEDDETYRLRIQTSWGRLSTAGAADAYRFFTASASTETLDVRPYGPEDHDLPGEVHLYILARNDGGIPSPALIDTVLASVSGKDVRPLTDYVTAYPAILVPFEVQADIYLPYGLDNDLVMASAREALNRYLALTYRIGVTLSCSGIFSVLHQSGTVTVRMRSPLADREMGIGEVGKCLAVRLNKVVLNGD